MQPMRFGARLYISSRIGPCRCGNAPIRIKQTKMKGQVMTMNKGGKGGGGKGGGVKEGNGPSTTGNPSGGGRGNNSPGGK